jgi:hypothetical protein
MRDELQWWQGSYLEAAAGTPSEHLKGLFGGRAAVLEDACFHLLEVEADMAELPI